MHAHEEPVASASALLGAATAEAKEHFGTHCARRPPPEFPFSLRPRRDQVWRALPRKSVFDSILNLTGNVINPILVSEMGVETKEETGSTPQRGQSILSPVLKARRVKHPRSHEEIVTDAEKKFSKTIAYLAK